MRQFVLVIATLLLTAALYGQTTIDGGRVFLGPVDSSSAASTKPFRAGLRQDLPSTCGQGETYLATDAEPSRMLYFCSIANTWTQAAYSQGTALPAVCAIGELYFKTDAAAGQNLFFCTTANGWTQMTGGGGGGSGNGISTASLPLTYSAATQTIACPTCEVSGNKGSANGYAALDSSGKVPTAQLPSTMTPSAHAATHAPNGSDPIATDWSSAAHSLPVKTGISTAMPPTCSLGELYFKTDASAGQNLYFCTTANTWTQMSGGGGSGSGYSQLKDHGVSEPQRTAVSFRDNLVLSDDGSANTIVDLDPNDARTVSFNDDFLTGTTTTGSLGLGWEYNQLGANGSILKADSSWPNLGVYRMTGTTAANNGWALHLGNTTSNLRPFGNLAGNTPWASQWIFKFTTTTKVRHRVGFAGICASVAPADIIGLRFDTNSGAPGGADSSNYKFEVRASSGTPILIDSGIAVDTNFHTLAVRMIAANRIGFSLDGRTEKLICAAGQTGCDATGTLPTANMDACAIGATDDTTAVELQVDKFSFSARVQTSAPTTNGRN